jgi:DNA-binding GntR family transcriptional regulator
MDKPIIQFTTAQEQVQNFLRERIISGDYPGGMRLKTDKLASLLDISRMPIREALRQLHAEGLVEIKRNHGASVVALSPADIMELFSIRAVLEGLASRQSVARLTGKDVKELEGLLIQMQNRQDGRVRWLARHDRFHDYLCGVSGMTRLSQQITRLRNQTRPYIRLYITTHDDPEPKGLEHRTLLDVVASGDADLAEATMRRHVIENGEVIVAFLASLPKSADGPPKPELKRTLAERHESHAGLRPNDDQSVGAD